MPGEIVNVNMLGSCRQIRLLHLVSTFAVKTDTKWLRQLLGGLSRVRFDPAIACMYGGGEMMQAFTGLGIQTYDLDVSAEVSLSGLWRTYRLIRSLEPHIVHTHLLRADLYGGLAARLAGVPVVLSTAYAVGPYRREKVRRLDNLLDQMCRAIATDGLAVSKAVRRDLIKRLRWPSDRITTIHTGIAFPDETSLNFKRDERTRIRAEWQVPQSSPLILTTARLSYEKGLDVLIRAAGEVHREVPEARFVVLGEGPLYGRLHTQIHEAGLQDVVRLAGFRDDVATVLLAGDLFVLPSLSEGMPNAVLEAYAAHLPVITTSAGGLPEAVEHERSGLLVPPANAEALATAITRVLKDQSLRERLAHDGHAWAKERFAVDRVVEQYEVLYERLVAQRASNSQTKALPLSGETGKRADCNSQADNILPGPVDVCGLPVWPVSRCQLLDTMITRAKQAIRTRVHYLNAHSFNLAIDQPGFHDILATSDLLYADGMSVVWAGRWLGRRIPERLSAADYFETFCRRCADEDVSVFLLGGAEGVSQAAAEKLTNRVPGLRIAGCCWGYFPEDQTPEVIDRVRESGADILIVGMGSPRQEQWVAKHGNVLGVPVCWTVGALLDYFADRERRAPPWVCRCGGEWFYRLMRRPAERWHRYLVGNPRFLWAVLRTWWVGSHRRQVA